ncbi:Integrase catalytic domain-containing protein [Citrus sinensis]|uniref:Integrase catalytic domain-containing protein n=1 Tax=Citrus sinensis TaxID=2711 RepID=A0ACB8JF03_CITSI|nr:Integrase catalytic domain-containing protein [Citrus sinensis]
MVEGETSRIEERSTETISGDTSGGRQDLSNRYSAPVVGGQKIDVEKFDGKINFGMWRREVMDALIQIDLDIVLKNKRHLYDEEIWDRMNEKTYGQIRSYLTKEVKYLVKDEECAHGVSMHDHVSRFEKLLADLKNLDEDIKNEVKAMILLHSLPDEYNHFVTTLIYEKSMIVFKDVCTTLTNLEIQNNDKNSERVSFEALVSRDWAMEKKKKRGGKNSRFKSRSRNIARDECTFCHEKGHWRKDCPKAQKRDEKKPAAANMAQKDEDSDYSLSKKTRVKFGTANHDTREILEYVHSDVWGPTKTASIGGSYYFITFVDDFSRRVWVYTMRAKVEILEIFVKWKKLVETQTDRKIKELQYDNGGEYTFDPFLQVCQNEGIKGHFTVRHTPQQNGVAERMNRTLLEKVQCMLSNAGLDKKFWAEAMSYASHLINRLPFTAIRGKTHIEMLSEKHAQDYDSLRIFGCPAYYHVKDGKLDPRARKTIFVGFKGGVKGFKLWDLEDKKFVCSRDVTFDEASLMKASSSQQVQNKTTEQGSPNQTTPRYKARLVAKDFAQKEGIDYNEVFSPVVKHTSIRILLALVAEYELELAQLDVKTTFLHGDLEEEIYMIQPCGFRVVGKENHVCRLIKSLYRLKQSPRSQEERDYMARVPYASVVGSLMYAMVCIGPDISQAVSMVSKYMHNPGKNHWLTVKWILRYLYGTVDVGLLFKKDYSQQCVGYCDSDFARDLDK